MYQLHSRKIKKNPKTLKFPPQEIISVKITNNNVKTMTYILSDTITFKTCRLKKKKSADMCIYSLPWWLRGWSVCLQCRRPGFNPWVGKIPWRRKWQLTPVFLPGESHGWRSLVGYSPWGCKESDTTEWLHYRYLYIVVLVTQLCPSLCALMDCRWQGFSVHGILQARKLEWVANPFSSVYISMDINYYKWETKNF